MRWRQAAFAALCHSDLFGTESCGRRLGCHHVRSLGRVPWKQFLSQLLLVLICHEVGMVTANHILGHFFSAFVAMGISVFCSFVFCEKRGVLFPPQLTHQNVLRMEQGCDQPHHTSSKMEMELRGHWSLVLKSHPAMYIPLQ